MNALEELCRIPLDDTSPTPLYQQLKQRLLQLIAIGAFPEGTALPTEQQICEALGLSRATVRRCFQDLVDQGHVTRRRGKGTFPVATSAEGIDVMIGFSDEMAHAGKTPSSCLINFKKIKGGELVCRSLKVHTGTQLWQTRRLRLANNRPLRLETSYIPCEFCPSLTQNDVTSSLYAYLAEHARIIPARAEDIYEAVTLDAAEAKLLAVPTGAAALHCLRVSYDTYDRPFELSSVYARGDGYRLGISMDEHGTTLRRLC